MFWVWSPVLANGVCHFRHSAFLTVFSKPMSRSPKVDRRSIERAVHPFGCLSCAGGIRTHGKSHPGRGDHPAVGAVCQPPVPPHLASLAQHIFTNRTTQALSSLTTPTTPKPGSLDTLAGFEPAYAALQAAT